MGVRERREGEKGRIERGGSERARGWLGRGKGPGNGRGRSTEGVH